MDTVRVGLLGLGVVGSAVAERLREPGAPPQGTGGRRLELAGVAVRDRARATQRLGGSELLRDSPDAIVDDPSIDIIVELIGGIEPARSLIARALDAGKAVVTANKQVIAHHGAELLAAGGDRLRFEAAVGGGIPVVETLRGGLVANRVTRIDAVVNGTSNVILDAMASGGDYASALLDAQRRGFAEADPTADVDGWDAAAKLAILVSLADGGWVHPDGVRRTGIRPLRRGDFRAAWLTGHSIRLLGRARAAVGGWTLSVEPTALRRPPSPHTDRRATPGHPLADLRGPDCGVLLHGDLVGPLVLRGAGAGGAATASAVLADVAALGFHPRASVPTPTGIAASPTVVVGDDEEEITALVIVESSDREGDADAVRLLLNDRGVGTRSAAYDTDDPDSFRLGLVTRPAARTALAAAVATLDADPRWEDAVRWLPVAEA